MCFVTEFSYFRKDPEWTFNYTTTKQDGNKNATQHKDTVNNSIFYVVFDRAFVLQQPGLYAQARDLILTAFVFHSVTF